MTKASSRLSTLVLGLGAGAGLMFFLDPVRGRKRRAMVGEKGRHFFNVANDELSRFVRHALDQANGTIAKAKGAIGDAGVSDVVLEARARAKLGRLVSHPNALRLRASHGRLVVSGPILAREVAGLHAGLAAVRGVTQVDDDLEVHASARKTTSKRSDPEDDIGWSPATGRVRGEMGFYRKLHVAAPLDKVFAFWKNFAGLPHFLSHVETVKPIGEGKYHWTIRGADGVTVEWDAEITREIPNDTLSWHSVAGSPIEHSGMIHVEPHQQGGTQMHVRFTYRHAESSTANLPVEDLFGASPLEAFEADCKRIDAYLEHGVSPAIDTAERPAVGV